MAKKSRRDNSNGGPPKHAEAEAEPRLPEAMIVEDKDETASDSIAKTPDEVVAIPVDVSPLVHFFL